MLDSRADEWVWTAARRGKWLLGDKTLTPEQTCGQRPRRWVWLFFPWALNPAHRITKSKQQCIICLLPLPCSRHEYSPVLPHSWGTAPTLTSYSFQFSLQSESIRSPKSIFIAAALFGFKTAFPVKENVENTVYVYPALVTFPPSKDKKISVNF